MTTGLTGAPARLGKYRIDEVLGEGAMGVVYGGFDPGIERRVALKTIRRQAGEDAASAADAAARFRNEAKAAGRLLHPGIVAVYEYGEDNATAYIAMEYVEGVSLARQLASGVRLADDAIVSLMLQLLDALEHAHAQGVWHRDIKPANLILTGSGRLKVADFGIARIESLALTRTHSLIGTPSHMAPEQFRGAAIDHRVDLYAAGTVLYELLAGRTPFKGSFEALMYQIVHDTPAAPSQIDSQRPPSYDAVVARAMEKEPARRFGDAGEFRRALVEAAQQAVEPELSDETVVLRAGAAGAAWSAAIATVASQSNTATAGWDPAVLARVEAALAVHVGPLARVLVRRATGGCSDEAMLRRRLGEAIGDRAARARFVEQTVPAASVTARRSAESTDDDQALTHVLPNSSPAASTPDTLEDAWLQNVQRVLARHIGPIARIVVTKAAQRSTSRDQLFICIGEALTDAETRERVIVELRRLEG